MPPAMSPAAVQTHAARGPEAAGLSLTTAQQQTYTSQGWGPPHKTASMMQETCIAPTLGQQGP